MSKQCSNKIILANAAGALFFLAVALVNQTGGLVVSLFWKACLFLGVFAGLYVNDFRFSARSLLVFSLIVVTGVLNTCFDGSTTLREQLLLLLLLLLSLVFTSGLVSEKTVLYLLYINCGIIIFRYATVGVYDSIFSNSSTNFVSVYLLYPAAVYYTLTEEKRHDAPLFPAIVIWVLCLLARGRGGIIATTFLLIGIAVIDFSQHRVLARLVLLMLFAAVAFCIIINNEFIVDKLNSSVITEYFRSRGMKSNSRIGIWKDYLGLAFDDWKKLLFGVNIDLTYAGSDFGGNLHNSFLNIHEHNGLIMLAVILWLLVNNTVRAIKKKRYVYLVCLFSFMLRSFTDNVFWPAYGSAVFFFLLFAPETFFPRDRRVIISLN